MITTTTIDLDRLHLATGRHSASQNEFCLLEAAARLAGEPHSDHPTCVSQILAGAGRALNDAIKDQAERDALKDCLPLMLNTAGDGLDGQRSELAWAWIVQVYTPAWLRLAGLNADADACASADPRAEASEPVALKAARASAAAAGDAAWAAAGAAAGDAAGAAAGDAAWAAAGDAAWDAAWDAAGDAAWDAAWAAAWAAAGAAAWAAAGDAAGAAAWAAAGDAARDAAWAAARAALKPTTDELRASFTTVFRQMCAVGADERMAASP